MKPKVVYIDGMPPVVGRGVWLYVKDHPRLGTNWVRTSSVIAITSGPCIETRNTVYVPEESFEPKSEHVEREIGEYV